MRLTDDEGRYIDRDMRQVGDVLKVGWWQEVFHTGKDKASYEAIHKDDEGDEFGYRHHIQTHPHRHPYGQTHNLT